ncbi:MAG: cyclic nucleotide-binding domain-containing protein [Desulfobacterales bacterium]|nr:cyclic nucleotide-binding domain-containing protein [Desulfobacterales bacterium]
MITLDFLEKVEVFKDLDDKQLTVIQEHSQIVEFGRGDKIFGTGDEPLYLWVVMAGEVDLHWELPGRSASAEKTISTLEETATFGWSSLVPPYSYRLSAYCAGRSCKLIKIPKDGLMHLFEKDAAIGYKVMTGLLAVIGSRFLKLQDEVARRKGSDIINRW